MSDAVTRFSPFAVDGGCDAYGDMEDDTQGDWVRYEDYEALTDRAIAAEKALATIERETMERAAAVAEEVASGRCAKCGSPRNNHPYRHPFIGITTGDIPTAIRAMIEEKTDE